MHTKQKNSFLFIFFGRCPLLWGTAPVQFPSFQALSNYWQASFQSEWTLIFWKFCNFHCWASGFSVRFLNFPPKVSLKKPTNLVFFSAKICWTDCESFRKHYWYGSSHHELKKHQLQHYGSKMSPNKISKLVHHLSLHWSIELHPSKQEKAMLKFTISKMTLLVKIRDGCGHIRSSPVGQIE